MELGLWRLSLSRSLAVKQMRSIPNETECMTRSELIKLLAERQPHLLSADVNIATRHILEQLASAFICGKRVEIRGFGVFETRSRAPRIARNPKTGNLVAVRAKPCPHFRPGRELRERVNFHPVESLDLQTT